MFSKEKLCLCLFLFLFVFHTNLYGQFYETGQDPSSIKWKQINTEHYQIIFPEKFDHEAQKLANVLHYIYTHVSFTLNHQPEKISVLVHNRTFYSNGVVAWAPKRMEVFTVPPQDIYPHEWLEQLAVHELRHVVQVDKMQQGITNILRYLFGEQAVGVVLGMIPLWFLEGDAVATETALSHSGRGSLSSFEMPLRALELEKKQRYSYEKAIYGSYKDYIPNHYQYGYQMVAYGRKQYGMELWENALNDVARHPYQLYPLYFSLKKTAGLSKNKIYHETFDTLKKAWKKQYNQLSYSDYEMLNTRHNNEYMSYLYPCFLNDTTIVVSKSRINRFDAFITVDEEGNEKKLVVPGIRNNNNLSAGSNKIVWEEYLYDIRWSNKNTSIIKVYDVSTRGTKTINYGTRLFSPAITADGNKIVAIEVTPENKYALVFFDAESGYILKHVNTPDNIFIQIPSWSKDGVKVFFTTLVNGKKGIGMYNVDTNEWKMILEPAEYNISHVKDAGDYLYYVASYSGIDNIYALDKKTGNIYQVTSSRFGGYYPVVSSNNKQLYYSNYTSKGFDLVRTEMDTTKWLPIRLVENTMVKTYLSLREQENTVIKTEDIPGNTYATKPYRKWSHLFHFHSWLPFYFDYNDYEITFDNYDIHPGFTLLSQNILSTAYTTIGYSYYNDMHHLNTGFTYKGIYPVFDFEAGYGGVSPVIHAEYKDSIMFAPDDYKHYRINIYVPLLTTSGNYFLGIQPLVRLSQDNAYFHNSEEDSYHNNLVHTTYNISFYRYMRMVKKDIYPRWGQSIFYQYSCTPFEDMLIGSVSGSQVELYFPGIIRHHGLRIKMGIQHQNVQQYSLSPVISIPRGYSPVFCNTLRSIALDYVFPFAHPDLNIGRILYCKRIKAALFYDFAIYEKEVSNEERTQRIIKKYEICSTGVDITTDFHFAHILFPFEAGSRVIFSPEEGTCITELLLRINTDIFN